MKAIAVTLAGAAAAFFFLCPEETSAQTGWTPARLFNDPNHAGDIKEPKLFPASGGGFHGIYRHGGGGSVQIQYRRFQNGALLPVVEVHRLGFLAGGDVCEAGDGALHVVWENWAENNEQIWWAKSVNGGLSFPTKQQVSNYGTDPNGQAKNPMVIPFGPAGSAEVLALSWGAAPTDALFYNRYNGSAWLGHTPVGQSTANYYAAWGCARDPRTGWVYRAYGAQIGGIWQIACRRYNGTVWEPQMVVSEHTTGFASRPALAVNAAGQLMVVWDSEEAVWGRLYDPATGWGAQMRIDDGFTASVTAIPGRNNFYLVHPYVRGEWLYIVGRRWANGAWGPRTRITSGLAEAFSVNPDVVADEQGHLYCVWEYWGTGQPRAWFSVLSNQPPALLISPTNLQGFLAPATVRLEATNADPAVTLTSVQFLQYTHALGVRSNAPFALTLSNLGPGNYSFRVVGRDTLGTVGTSAPVNVVVVDGTQTSLVPVGAVWKYFTNRADLGTAWRAPDYDDRAWPSGPAQLGYGDGDEATRLAEDRQRITTYFRHRFVVPFARAVKALTVRLLRDDGAAVYLNGVELLRSNLPDPADYLTLAVSAIGGADETNWLTYVVNPAALVPGTNVLAVEVHQVNTNSSDLSFDLELISLRAAPTPPRLNFNAPSPHEAFLEPASFTLLAAADDDDGDIHHVEFTRDGSVFGRDFAPPFTASLTNLPAGEYVFAARAWDNLGLSSATTTINVPVVAGSRATLVATGAAWRYRDTGTDPGTNWTSRFYNDTAWAAGPAPLGYGDGDEATTIGFGPDPNAKHITSWFRHRFTVTEPRDLIGLSLRVQRDDGAVVYLNGVEVFRSNLPEGPITPSTLALQAVAGAEESAFFSSWVDAGLLVAGTNVLAAEAHQVAGTSSDVSFDAELTALRVAPPRLRARWGGGAVELSWPASARDYAVMMATNLRSPILWQPLQLLGGVWSGQQVRVYSNLVGAAFFRLERP